MPFVNLQVRYFREVDRKSDYQNMNFLLIFIVVDQMQDLKILKWKNKVNRYFKCFKDWYTDDKYLTRTGIFKMQ